MSSSSLRAGTTTVTCRTASARRRIGGPTAGVQVEAPHGGPWRWSEASPRTSRRKSASRCSATTGSRLERCQISCTRGPSSGQPTIGCRQWQSTMTPSSVRLALGACHELPQAGGAEEVADLRHDDEVEAPVGPGLGQVGPARPGRAACSPDAGSPQRPRPRSRRARAPRRTARRASRSARRWSSPPRDARRKRRRGRAARVRSRLRSSYQLSSTLHGSAASPCTRSKTRSAVSGSSMKVSRSRTKCSRTPGRSRASSPGSSESGATWLRCTEIACDLRARTSPSRAQGAEA